MRVITFGVWIDGVPGDLTATNSTDEIDDGRPIPGDRCIGIGRVWIGPGNAGMRGEEKRVSGEERDERE